MENLIVERYPSKLQFQNEVNRDDCGSYPSLHVEIHHPDKDVLDLFNSVKHLFPYWPNLLSLTPDKVGLVQMHDITFNHGVDGECLYTIDLWLDASKKNRDFWVEWAKKLIRKCNKSKMYERLKLKGLKIRIRVEFHD